MTIARSILERRTIRDNSLWGAWAAGDEGVASDAATGVRVTRNGTLGLAAVWACVGLISDAIATMPLDTFTIAEDGVKTPFRPRPMWIEDPNPEQTAAEFMFGVCASLLLDGNAFIYTARNTLGDVIEAYAIDPHFVQVRREYVNGRLQLVYYVMVSAGQQSPVGPIRVPAGPEMFHITAYNPNSNWPRGLSPLEVHRQQFAASLANQEMGARFFGHGMNASGIITVPGDMTKEQARQLKSDFGAANGGVRKMHLPPVLTGGASWVQTSVSPEQAQFLESRQYGREEVARIFNVPLWMIQANDKTTSWGSGIEQQGIAFVTYTLRKWTTRIQQGFQKHTLMPFHPGVELRFNMKDLMRGDHAARAAYYNAGRFGGWLCADDIRIDEDRPPLPDGAGQIFLQPVNMTAPGNLDPAAVPLPSTTAPASDGGPDSGQSA